MYKWQQVKALRAKGVSIKKIARKLKLSKNTVRKYLRSHEPPQFKARRYEKMLNEYEDKVELYSVSEVSDVLAECIRIGAYHKNSVKRLLSLRKIHEPVAVPAPAALIFPSVDITRGLSAYRVEVSHE
jgi:Helix-turn-helix domain of resolvase.